MKKLILRILFGKSEKGEPMVIVKHVYKTSIPTEKPPYHIWCAELEVSSAVTRERVFIHQPK